ncbi:sugar transferase [Aliishimia ponticola]|uniref:Sugar transferase n=1 Tax=Aliishimia ponticola TaxID=2499833 RepID=A0A4S4NH69_9RHOB|nr:sugar transferase [Aliishimia ponticola]THH35430.1 sugar transferase [Aliishimia ponticola]
MAGQDAPFYLRHGKRLFDITASLLILPLILPLIAIIGFIVRLDGGPGFFGHARVGQDGHRFRCWKIRTMVPNAEAVLKAHLANNPAAAAEWARDHKLSNDPRVTRLGNFLRKSSLDELPQIWNVLRGEMSLVGPRPIVTAEIAKYGPYKHGYLAMKPGVTGLWQVSGRNDVTYQERVLLDMDYLAQRSFWMDMRVLFLTVTVLFAWTGK